MQHKSIKSIAAAGMVVLVLAVAACSAASPASMEAPSYPAGEAAIPAAPVEAQLAQEGGTTDALVTRKVVATARLDLVVEDTQTTVDAVNALMDEVGGYISATNLSKSYYSGSESLQGTLTLRVPAEALDTTLTRLAELAIDVRSRSLDRQDVTDQYSDIDADLRNLEATETELRAMLQEVRERPNSTTEDIMSVYRTLTDVRGEIEQLRGRKNLLDNQIAMSTVNLTLTPDIANLPVVEEGWRPAVVMRGALRALTQAVQALGNVVIWGVFFLLPLVLIALIPIAIAIWLLRWLIRRFSRPKPQPITATRPQA
jgi:hypothetical protein